MANDDSLNASPVFSPRSPPSGAESLDSDSVGSLHSQNPPNALPPDLSTGRSHSTTSGLLRFISSGPAEPPKKRFLSLYRLLMIELNLPDSSLPEAPASAGRDDVSRAYAQLEAMVRIPLYLEKFIAFGLLVCLNSFLTLFTLVPLKIAIVTFTAFADYMRSATRDGAILTRKLFYIKRDMITLLLIICSVAILASPVLEVSRLYHDIRGQAHIKLYVMFGVLEVTDKLLSSTTQEIFTVLVGLSVTDTSSRNVAQLVLFSTLALVFFVCHAYALIYQSVSLHVAANSYSNALLALLLSNQFAELKSAVFKKFEREGLFQVAMSDLTERFQLSVMLFVIALRNLSQLSSTQLELVPDSWKSWNKWFGAIFGPSVVVLGSEIFVDWIKHCYINKFNLMRPRVYDNFLYVLSSDFMEVFSLRSNVFSLREASDYVILTKRIGLPIISLTICFLRMSLRDLSSIFLPSTILILSILSSLVLVALSFVALLVTRLLLSLWLLKWARRIKHKHETYQRALRSTLHTPTRSISEPPSEMLSTQEKSRIVQSVQEIHTLPQEASYLRFATPPPTELDTKAAEDMSESAASPVESEIEMSFIPGIPNTESSSINPSTRSYLYDLGESVPPTLEEKRNAQFARKRVATPVAATDPLSGVLRYEMSSKRIW